MMNKNQQSKELLNHTHCDEVQNIMTSSSYHFQLFSFSWLLIVLFVVVVALNTIEVTIKVNGQKNNEVVVSEKRLTLIELFWKKTRR